MPSYPLPISTVIFSFVSNFLMNFIPISPYQTLLLRVTENGWLSTAPPTSILAGMERQTPTTSSMFSNTPGQLQSLPFPPPPQQWAQLIVQQQVAQAQAHARAMQYQQQQLRLQQQVQLKALPAAKMLDLEAPPGIKVFEIVVPAGVTPGSTFSFTIAGKRASLQCPPTAAMGTVIRCQISLAAIGLQDSQLQQTGGEGGEDTSDTELIIDDLEGFEDLSDHSTFHKYNTGTRRGCVSHPDPLVESSSLAAVGLPSSQYKLILPRATYERGKLSSPQLDTIICASMQHEKILSSGARKGYFLGDGAGVGKGRQLAGIIFENWLRGRKKHIWLSASTDLIHDSQRDLDDVGASFIPCQSINKLTYGPIDKTFPEGVVFVTYSSLVASSGKRSRLKQLQQWCGSNFEGCVMFDESHKAKNLTTGTSGNGQKGSKAANAVAQLQDYCPNARVVYCSATGASEPANMAYMNRLGLWGKGTPFEDGFPKFRNAVERGGVGMMELVAMHMKRCGSYICRTLSFEGCTFEVVEDAFSSDQLRTYDLAAVLFQDMFRVLKEVSSQSTLDTSYQTQLNLYVHIIPL